MDIRTQLIEAALKVYASAGIRGATTRRIADAAGVNEVTLFRHFGSKEALIRDALFCCGERALAVRFPEVPSDPEAELLAFATAHHEGLRGQAALIRKTMAEFEDHPEALALAREMTARIDAELEAYLVRLRDAGLARGEWSPRIACELLMGTLFSDAVMRDCMPERYPAAPVEAVRAYVALFLRAIGVVPLSGASARTEPQE